MKVRCIYNTGEALRDYEYQRLKKTSLGRFGATGHSEYGALDIGTEYLVMGIVVFKTYQGYLIDSGRLPSVFPCQLFELVDDNVNDDWHYRLIEKSEDIYPFVQAVFGYKEFCHDPMSYEKLIVDIDEEALQIYFDRKAEVETGSTFKSEAQRSNRGS